MMLLFTFMAVLESAWVSDWFGLATPSLVF